MPDLKPEQARPLIATPEDYRQTFEGFRPGQKVLEDLVARFHDRAIWMPGGAEGARETERRAAQKEVVGFILRKIGQINEESGDADS